MPNILTDFDYQKSSCYTLERLRDNNMVEGKDLGFVNSLLNQYKTKHKLSPKQWPWIEKMMINAMGLADPTTKPKFGDSASVKFAVDASNLFNMFLNAKTKLKYPSLLFGIDTPDGMKEIKIYPRYTGDLLYVKWYDKQDGKYVGIITGGEFSYDKYLKDDLYDAVETAIKKICENPAKALARHGKMMNKCSFCASELTDPKSVAHGYGPVCAKNWGLVW